MPPVATRICPQCGAPLDEQDRFCGVCGAVEATSRPPPLPPQSRDQFLCDNCGAKIRVSPNQRSYTCEHCGSTYVFDFAPEAAGRQPPEFVLGFAITPEKARQILLHWANQRGSFWARSLQEALKRATIRGVYLPFWSFSMLVESDWTASIGEYWYRTETYTTIEDGKPVTRTRQVRETEWWPLAGKYHQYLSGYLISASRNLPQPVADQLLPYHLPALRRYDPAFLAGWPAEEYALDHVEAEGICKDYFQSYQAQCVAQFLPGDTYANLSVDTTFRDEASDLILLPVYMIRYEYRGRPYRLWMNGQTGKIAGELPPFWLTTVLWALAIMGGLGVAIYILAQLL